MKMFCKDLGERRWICHIKFKDWNERQEFSAWSQNHPGLWLHESQFAPEFDIEVRSGDLKLRTLMIMKWS